MGEKITGAKYFAYFSRKSYELRGPKNIEKKAPAGTGKEI